MKMKSPKLIAAVLVGGTLVLLGGGALAATLPSSSHRTGMMQAAAAMATTSTLPPSSSPAPIEATPITSAAASAAPSHTVAAAVVPSKAPRSSAPGSHPAKPAVRLAPLTYVVKAGDTLSGIAAWFKLHGYGDLYNANAAVIGANPNLILPGERITIGTGVMSVEASS